MKEVRASAAAAWPGVLACVLCAAYLAAAALGAEAPDGREAKLRLYPALPAGQSDGKVSGTVNGKPVGFEYFRTSKEYYYDVNYTWFAAAGPVDVRLTLDVPVPVRSARLRTVLKDIPFRRTGATLAFTLPGPGNYYLQLPDLGQPKPGRPDSGTYTVLFFVDDLRRLRAERMAPTAPGVQDVTRHGVVSDARKDQTGAIDALLRRGGRVLFPRGIYRARRLRPASGTTVYLAPGALIQGTDEGVANPFIDLAGRNDVRIHGPGTIDAAGHHTHIVNTDGSRNIRLEDALFRNSASWAIHLLKVDKALVRNVRILSGKDGIDPDCARDVTIEGCIILSKDDSIAVKARKPPATTERVVVRDCLVASDASALKVGTETRALIRDVTFENCDVFDSDRGIVLYARDGGPVENVVWRNLRMHLIDWPHETRGAPMEFVIRKRRGLTPVRNCLVENVETNCRVSSSFAGLAGAPLDGLKMRNITIRVGAPAARSRPPLFDVGRHVRVTLDGLKIDWQGHRKRWGDVVSGSGLTIRMRRE